MIRPGTKLAHYEVVSALGKGGMGEVWRARDTRLGRDVAIKTMSGESSGDSDRLARFTREARILGSLNHANIAQIYGVEDTGETLALVLELVEGPTLAERLASGPVPAGEALRVGEQIARALEAAHQAGVMHRDLKPANIKIRPDGVVKVLDFGLAKTLGAKAGDAAFSSLPTRDIDATGAGVMLGTVPYMSPEQLKGEPHDPRTDLWAMGCVLYEMVSGTRPFTGNSPAELITSILRDRPAPVGTRVGNVPPALGSLIDDCLRKDPAGRPRTATDLRLRLSSIGREDASGDAPRAPDRSVAVLPFSNLSPDPDNAYFSDGLSEEIINALARLPGLRVIARTSAFRFRDEGDLRKVGKALEVRTVLEGSVRKAGNRIRIAVQLIDTGDNSHLWSERFDRELTDVFAVQDEIAAAIAGRLDASLGPTPHDTRPARRPTRNMAAYEALLEGRHHWNRFTPEGARKALDCYERALALDPDYPDALVDMAFCESVVAWMFVDPRDPLRRMNALAARALAQDPDHGEAHGALAFGVLWSEWDWAAADRLFRRAITLAPASSNNLALYGVVCRLGQGAFEDAASWIHRGIELDPLAGRIRALEARVLTCQRQFSDAEARCRRALELDPGHPLTVIEFAWALAFQGRTDEALTIVRGAIDVHGPIKALVPLLGAVHAMAGRTDEALRLADGPSPGDGSAYVTPFTGVAVYATLGDLDRAYDRAAQCVDELDLMMLYLKVHPVFEPMRADRRYSGLLGRVNLT